MNIEGCKCWDCKKFHTHIYPHPRSKGKNICINCLNKRRKKC